MTWLLPNRFGSLRLDFCALGLGSYLIELVVDESVDQGWLADPAVSDEDDIAVVSWLGQTVPDTPHHGRTKHRRIKTEACLSKRSHKNDSFFLSTFLQLFWFFFLKNTRLCGTRTKTTLSKGRDRERTEREREKLTACWRCALQKWFCTTLFPRCWYPSSTHWNVSWGMTVSL